MFTICNTILIIPVSTISSTLQFLDERSRALPFFLQLSFGFVCAPCQCRSVDMSYKSSGNTINCLCQSSECHPQPETAIPLSLFPYPSFLVCLDVCRCTSVNVRPNVCASAHAHVLSGTSKDVQFSGCCIGQSLKFFTFISTPKLLPYACKGSKLSQLVSAEGL